MLGCAQLHRVVGYGLKDLLWVGMSSSNNPEKLVGGELLLPGLGQLAFKILQRTIAMNGRDFGRHDGSIL
jgi:hypothetical protein